MISGGLIRLRPSDPQVGSIKARHLPSDVDDKVEFVLNPFFRLSMCNCRIDEAFFFGYTNYPIAVIKEFVPYFFVLNELFKCELLQFPYSIIGICRSS